MLSKTLRSSTVQVSTTPLGVGHLDRTPVMALNQASEAPLGAGPLQLLSKRTDRSQGRS